MAKKTVRAGSFSTIGDDIFVLKHKNDYRVLRTTSEKAIRVTKDKDKAIMVAKSIQIKVGSDIYVMDDKGKLIDRYAFKKSAPIVASAILKKGKQIKK